MTMQNTDKDFYGKQDGERILYVAKPHTLALVFKLIKIYVIAFIVFIAFFVLGTILASAGALFVIGVVIAAAIAIIGTKVVVNYQKRDLAYITDRRLIRFEPTTLVSTNSRSLTWEEAVKVKTYPPNFLWKELALGNVVVHARSSVTVMESPRSVITVDDIEINDVYLYKDLGNYIDKILFTYKQRPKEMDSIHEFVPKPKGERY